MAKQVLNNLDFNNVAKIVNLVNGTNAQDACTFGQLNAAIEGLAAKDNVQAASTGNVSLTSPGASMDGVTLATGNRLLLKDQTNAPDNGIYIWNGATSTLTRAYDASANPDLLSAITTVDAGTVNQGTSWRQTAINITLGTTNIAWTPFGVVTPAASTTTPGSAAIATQAEVNAGTVSNKIVTPLTLANWTGLLHKVAFFVGDGSTTQFDLAHNLNSTDVQVEVYRNSSPYDSVLVDVERPSATTARVRFAVAPSSNAFKVVVVG